MNFFQFTTVGAITCALFLAACGSSAAGCPTVTLEFPDGETTLERKDMKAFRAAAEKTLEKCPYVHIESYIAGDEQETARWRKNHVKNLFSVAFSDASKGRTDAVIPAPSNDLAGKVKVMYSDKPAE